jgi:16S rRNA (guanine966-N2)-methyltransferase
MRMRIVGGRHRGRALAAPPGGAIRPTSDRAREALFNILEHGRFAKAGGSLVPGATVLDAFAGTGAFALEALSRGAAHTFLLELDPAALAAARDNAIKLGEIANLTIRRADATHPGPAPAAASIAFLDPPYASGLAAPALEALARQGWLAPDALAVVELDGREPFRPPAGFEAVEERRYGRARLVFLRHAP